MRGFFPLNYMSCHVIMQQNLSLKSDCQPPSLSKKNGCHLLSIYYCQSFKFYFYSNPMMYRLFSHSIVEEASKKLESKQQLYYLILCLPEAKKRKNLSHCERLFTVYFILFDSCLFNKETDKRPRNQRNHHKRILFFLNTLREFLGMFSQYSKHPLKVMGLIPGWETRFHKLCDAGKKEKKHLNFQSNCFGCFIFLFCLFQNLLSTLRRKKTNRK